MYSMCCGWERSRKAPRTWTLFPHVCRWIRGRERRRWRGRCILRPFLRSPSDSTHTLGCPSPAECRAAYEFVCVRHVACCCFSELDTGPALPGSRRAASPSKTRLTQQWRAAWCNYPAASWDVPGKKKMEEALSRGGAHRGPCVQPCSCI